MEPFVVVGVVVFAVLIGLWFLAIRQHAKGNNRFVGTFYLPQLLGGIFMTLAGLAIVGKHPLTGFVLLAIGAITIALVARLIVRAPRMDHESSLTGDVPGPVLDYVIWASIGIPMVFAALLIVLLITGGLRSS